MKITRFIFILLIVFCGCKKERDYGVSGKYDCIVNVYYSCPYCGGTSPPYSNTKSNEIIEVKKKGL